MKEISKQEFTSIIMQLILFSQRLEKVIAYSELIVINKAVSTLRYWMQFAPEEKGGN